MGREPARSPRWTVLTAVLLPTLAGCYASNVVAVRDRAVTEAELAPDWGPVAAAQIPGYYESARVTGDAALSVRRIYYWFGAQGSYTGAALTDGDAGLAFQTLSGQWRLTADGLVLDDGDAVPVQAAAGHLRLQAPAGELVLRRVPLP